ANPAPVGLQAYSDLRDVRLISQNSASTSGGVHICLAPGGSQRISEESEALVFGTGHLFAHLTSEPARPSRRSTTARGERASASPRYFSGARQASAVDCR